jgi:hypothetical protein
LIPVLQVSSWHPDHGASSRLSMLSPDIFALFDVTRTPIGAKVFKSDKPGKPAKVEKPNASLKGPATRRPRSSRDKIKQIVKKNPELGDDLPTLTEEGNPVSSVLRFRKSTTYLCPLASALHCRRLFHRVNYVPVNYAIRFSPPRRTLGEQKDETTAPSYFHNSFPTPTLRAGMNRQ